MGKNKNKNSIAVISKHGEPLMPTKRYGKVRHMLKNGEAKIIKRDPFLVIQLLVDTTGFKQPLKAGMDIGETIGLSIINDTKEVFSAELKTRSSGITDKLEERTSYRRARRGKLRYRQARFENRGASKGTCKHCGRNSKSGQLFCGECLKNVNGIHQKYKDDKKTYNEKRLAPSVKHRVETHFSILDKFNMYFPMNDKDWVIEKTKFDIQKIENIDISGGAYQQGDMFGFSNVRDFVLDRDNHECQNPNCKHNKKKVKKSENIYIKNNIILKIHHVKYRSKGGTDKPSNLITLCEDCHTSANHQYGNFLYDWCIGKLPVKIKNRLKQDYSSATNMNVVSCAFNENNRVKFTYGSETKRKRQLLGLEKTHSNDAFAIAFSETNFEKEDQNNGTGDKVNIRLKDDIEIEKINDPLIINQTNGKESGRRSLRTLKSVYFIDSRDDSVKKSTELTRVVGRNKTNRLTQNERVFRKVRCNKSGKLIKKSTTRKYRKDGQRLDNNVRFQTKKSQYPNGTLVKFDINNKPIILESAGISNSNIYVKNYMVKTLAAKKYKAKVICNRRGMLKENIKNI